MRILLVEDDEAIAEVVKQGLEESFYSVDIAYDGIKGLKMADAELYSLLILDVMLPGMDGFEICRSLRRSKNPVPILMLTALDGVDDCVQGLDVGADDYLPKPFEFSELIARVRALLRRDKIHRSRVIRIGDLEIDTGSHQASRSGQEIRLTPREYDLLEALASHEGRPISREAILDHVWMDDESLSNTVDVCIGQLRKKVDSDYDIKLIHTIHRVGYMMKEPDKAAK